MQVLVNVINPLSKIQLLLLGPEFIRKVNLQSNLLQSTQDTYKTLKQCEPDNLAI